MLIFIIDWLRAVLHDAKAFNVKHFECQFLGNTVGDGSKIRNMTRIDSDDCHRITSLRMFCCLTVIYIFRVDNFQC